MDDSRRAHDPGHRVESAVVVLRLRGELDAYSAPTLQESVTALFARSPRRLVIDVSAVTFLDSTVLGLLAGALRQARETERDLHFVLPVGPARRIFELTGLDRVFPRATVSDLQRATEVLAEPQHGATAG